MRIGFDAKRAMLNYTGLGNYSRFVIESLRNLYPQNIYQLYTPKIGDKDIAKTLESIFQENIITNQNNKVFWRSFGISDDINKEKLDIYHGLSNELPLNIHKTEAKSVVTIHDLIFLKYPKFYPFLERTIYNIKAKYACKHADKIIAVSKCTKRDIIKYYKTDPSKIEVVYQGCSNVYKNIVDQSEKDRVRTEYNLPAQYILSVGSIEDRKNILLVVKALKYLPNDLHFVAVGRKRKYAEKVLKYAEKYNVAHRLHIIENMPQTDLPSVMQAASLFVYPSLYEGFGIPVIEAISSRIPVIAATGSCLEEAGGEHSIYVNPISEEELATQIIKVLMDDELQKTMIEEGLKHIRKFTEENSANQIMNIYKSII